MKKFLFLSIVPLITWARISPPEPFKFTEQQLEVINDMREVILANDLKGEKVNYGKLYEKIYEMITDKGLLSNKPKAGVETSVWQFMKRVSYVNTYDVNPNTSWDISRTYGTIIWEYNKSQHKIRYNNIDDVSTVYVTSSGKKMTALDIQVKTASNRIAEAIIAHILDKAPSFDENRTKLFKNPNHYLPTIDQIAIFDAISAVTYTKLFPKEKGGWAGNPFFLLLADERPFRENILHSLDADGKDVFKYVNEKPEGTVNETVYHENDAVPPNTIDYNSLNENNKKEIMYPLTVINGKLTIDGDGDTYDILSMLKAIDDATERAGTGHTLALLFTKVKDVLENNDLHDFNKASEFAAGNFYKALRLLQVAYGEEEILKLGIVAVGAVLSNLDLHVNKNILVIGTSLDDINVMGTIAPIENNFVGAGDNLINTGAGNDKIIATRGNDIIDGSKGTDEVDYSNMHRALFKVGDPAGTSASSSALVHKAADPVYFEQRFPKATRSLPDGSIYDSKRETIRNLSTDRLFHIEKITGTPGDDEFLIVRDMPNLFIDGGGGENIIFGAVIEKDTDSKNALVKKGMRIDLGAGTMKRITDNHLVVKFKNISGAAGTMASDIIIGDDNVNFLSGGDGGDDTFIGGAGKDKYQFSADYWISKYEDTPRVIGHATIVDEDGGEIKIGGIVIEGVFKRFGTDNRMTTKTDSEFFIQIAQNGIDLKLSNVNWKDNQGKQGEIVIINGVKNHSKFGIEF